MHSKPKKALSKQKEYKTMTLLNKTVVITKPIKHNFTTTQRQLPLLDLILEKINKRLSTLNTELSISLHSKELSLIQKKKKEISNVERTKKLLLKNPNKFLAEFGKEIV